MIKGIVRVGVQTPCRIQVSGCDFGHPG